MRQIAYRLMLSLSLLLAWVPAGAQQRDAVSVYLIPLDDFPEEVAAALAKVLQDHMGLAVKASLKLPPLPVQTLPGGKQLISEDLISQAAQASSRLPGLGAKTYRIFLTGKDINTKTANLRFQFSS